MRDLLTIIDRLSQPISALCLIASEIEDDEDPACGSFLPREAAKDARQAAGQMSPLFDELRAAARTPRKDALISETYTFASRDRAKVLSKAVVAAFPAEVIDTVVYGDPAYGVCKVDGAPVEVHAFCRGFLAALEVAK